ncbi:hypothetical protein RFI_30719 [Reticulomyxa filosa]|uniref:Calpain catalytic domain-containing protein n=1 Tax=Reticulomyxa filosa TaxID=46433 RepID=X6LYG1_RETFI|nr:hypothetical protein RFI_30719 [Reticulomyxa filosa]|eukprot:ETO06674.1 hypothetical protein RFI_30719 [Reticulomyxa filosa]
MFLACFTPAKQLKTLTKSTKHKNDYHFCDITIYNQSGLNVCLLLKNYCLIKWLFIFAICFAKLIFSDSDELSLTSIIEIVNEMSLPDKKKTGLHLFKFHNEFLYHHLGLTKLKKLQMKSTPLASSCFCQLKTVSSFCLNVIFDNANKTSSNIVLFLKKLCNFLIIDKNLFDHCFSNFSLVSLKSYFCATSKLNLVVKNLVSGRTQYAFEYNRDIAFLSWKEYPWSKNLGMLFHFLWNKMHMNESKVLPNPLWSLIYPQNQAKIPMESPNGLYFVRLYYCGEWRCVTINDETHNHLLLPKISNTNEIWPLLISKALIKLHVLTNQYAASIENGFFNNFLF